MSFVNINEDPSVKFPIDEIITRKYKDPKNPINSRYVMIAVFASIFGTGIPTGHCFSVINTPERVIRKWINITIAEQYGTYLSDAQNLTLWGFVVSLYLAGALLGSYICAPIANKIGRRSCLMVTELIFLASGLLLMSCSFVNVIEFLIIGRFLTGFAGGMSSSIMPLYLSEIAHPAYRGIMGTMFQMAMCTGVLISQILGQSSILGTADKWHFLVGFHVLLTGFSLLLHPMLPSSPVYQLIFKKDEKAARKDLDILRNGEQETIDKEIKDMFSLQSFLKNSSRPKLAHFFQNDLLKRGLIATVVLNIGQQFIGISPLFLYTTLLFSKSGLDEKRSQLAPVGAAVANMVMSAVGIILIKFFKRKLLLLTSSALYISCLSAFITGLYYINDYPWARWLSFVALFMAVFSYQIGNGSVPYMIGTEIFPANVRSYGLAIGCACNWAGNLIVTLTFPIMQLYLGCMSFIVFIVNAILLSAFVVVYVPETYQSSAAANKKPSEIDFSISSN